MSDLLQVYEDKRVRKTDQPIKGRLKGLKNAVGNVNEDFMGYEQQDCYDFLQVFLGSYEWPSFNVADSCICIGATLLAIDLLWGRARETAAVRTS